MKETGIKKAVENKGKVVVTDPYRTASTNTMVVTVVQQTKDGSGVVAINMKIDELLKTTKKVNIGKSGYAFILTKDKKSGRPPEPHVRHSIKRGVG